MTEKKVELKEDEDNLLDDLNKIDNEDKKKDEEPSPEELDNEPAPEEKNIVDLMVAGDTDAVRDAVHKHVVSVVATSVNNIDKDQEPESDDGD